MKITVLIKGPNIFHEVSSVIITNGEVSITSEHFKETFEFDDPFDKIIIEKDNDNSDKFFEAPVNLKDICKCAPQCAS